MYLHLQAAKGKRLELVDLTPHIQRRDLAPPAWVYIPMSGCGPWPGDRHFIFDLDKPLLTDAGIEGGPNRKTDAPTADLGTGFVINDHDDAQIRLDALSCTGNYQWTLAVRYVEAGNGEVKTVEIGPITSYGRADNSIRYVGYPGPDGVVKVREQTNITGGDPYFLQKECHGS
ncbi:hypothetical protein A5647_24775 [Mycobacterium sp. 1100029.7]|nr:hypothetical protein A5647_24775 [Mycobacterium sp. 1100029.7]